MVKEVDQLEFGICALRGDVVCPLGDDLSVATGTVLPMMMPMLTMSALNLPRGMGPEADLVGKTDSAQAAPLNTVERTQLCYARARSCGLP